MGKYLCRAWIWTPKSIMKSGTIYAAISPEESLGMIALHWNQAAALGPRGRSPGHSSALAAILSIKEYCEAAHGGHDVPQPIPDGVPYTVALHDAIMQRVSPDRRYRGPSIEELHALVLSTAAAPAVSDHTVASSSTRSPPAPINLQPNLAQRERRIQEMADAIERAAAEEWGPALASTVDGESEIGTAFSVNEDALTFVVSCNECVPSIHSTWKSAHRQKVTLIQQGYHNVLVHMPRNAAERRSLFVAYFTYPSTSSSFNGENEDHNRQKPAAPPGRRSIRTGDQLVYMKGFLPTYKSASGPRKAKGPLFWDPFFNGWFARWPVPEPDVPYGDCKSDEEYAAKVKAVKAAAKKKIIEGLKSWFTRQTQSTNDQASWKVFLESELRPRRGAPRRWTEKTMHKFYMTLDDYKDKVDEQAREELGGRTATRIENLSVFVRPGYGTGRGVDESTRDDEVILGDGAASGYDEER